MDNKLRRGSGAKPPRYPGRSSQRRMKDAKQGASSDGEDTVRKKRTSQRPTNLKSDNMSDGGKLQRSNSTILSISGAENMQKSSNSTSPWFKSMSRSAPLPFTGSHSQPPRKTFKRECKYCGTLFTAEVRYKAHLEVCLTYKCKFCSFKSESQGLMKTHEKNRHRKNRTGKNYICCICGLEFTGTVSFLDHKTRAHGT
eukprot:gb/GEZJ01007504.1/.p1 GENE.gb/GEZJ01007504.1/~~gb/GEZJ01007504.1/.p1  ORF type:complete len:198 (-),score=13.66 gb/GEZJ01007504.1/:315-908(-)